MEANNGTCVGEYGVTQVVFYLITNESSLEMNEFQLIIKLDRTVVKIYPALFPFFLVHTLVKIAKNERMEKADAFHL